MYRATHPHPRCQPPSLALGDVLTFRDGKSWSLKVESSHSSGWTHNHGPRFLPNQQHWERSTICWIPNGSHKTPSNIPIQSLGTHCAHRCPPWALSRVYISHKSVALPNWWPEIFFSTLILLQGKRFSISIWCMSQNICVAADFHDVPLWWHELGYSTIYSLRLRDSRDSQHP